MFHFERLRRIFRCLNSNVTLESASLSWRRLLVKRLLDSLFKLPVSDLIAAGFTYEYSMGIEGWISRDPSSLDWILWSNRENKMYIRKNDPNAAWQPAPEGKRECIMRGRLYAESKNLLESRMRCDEVGEMVHASHPEASRNRTSASIAHPGAPRSVEADSALQQRGIGIKAETAIETSTQPCY